MNSHGERMEYEGVGSRFASEFGFVSNDESKVFTIESSEQARSALPDGHIDDLRDWEEGFLRNDLAGGILQCEESELFLEKILVED